MNEKRFLNILVVNYEYPPVGGGGGYICRNVMEEIVRMGHHVTVVTTHYKDLPLYENWNGVQIHRVPVLMRTKQDTATLTSMLSFVPACISKVNKLMSENTYDVINTHFAIPSGPAGYFLSKKYDLPNILDIYGGDVYDPTKALSPHKTPILKQTVRKMLNSAERVISDSSDIVGHARNFYGITRDILIVPPGLAPYNAPLKSRSELGLPEDKLLISTLGRLITRKNNVELIEVLHRVRQHVDCHLLIIGEGEDRVNIENKIRELNLGDHVTMAGRIEDEKFQMLAASDVYVSTATHEGFGLVFLEAMESSLPVVCYNNGGQVDFLKDGVTGYLVNLGDKETFTNKLVVLLKDDGKRKKMRDHNKEYIKEFYIRNGAEDHLKEYKEAIESRFPSSKLEKEVTDPHVVTE